MLKLYRKTYICSIGAAIMFFVASIAFEMSTLSRAAFAVNYCTGIACSLVVVIITSYLQYKHEQTEIFAEYSTALRELISLLGQAFCGYDTNDISDKFCESRCAEINKAFDAYFKLDEELLWIARKKVNQQRNVLKSAQKLYIDFHKHYYKSKKDAFCDLRFNGGYIPLTDNALAIVKNKRDRFSIEDNKRLALEFLENAKES